jgi:septal ring factor EnvC (AmiA/AmiB activator)
MASMDDIHKALKEVSDRTIRMEVSLDAHSKYIEEIKSHLIDIQHQDQEQNRLLAEHIAGVRSTRELITIETKRLENEIQAREDFQKIHEVESNNRHKDAALKIKELDAKVLESEKIRNWFILTVKLFGGIATIGGGIVVLFTLASKFIA